VYTTSVIAALALILGTLFTAPALAQVQRSGGGGASAQLMQQYQQLAAERTQLQADNAKLKKDFDDLKKQLDGLKQQASVSKAGASRSEAAIVAARAENDSNAKALADTKSKMQELIGRFRETITQLRTLETERTELQQQVAQSTAAYDKCAERNYSLYQTTAEVLDRYEHQGAFSYLARSEPFTRLKRTQIENLVDEYRQRVEELRVKIAPVPGGGVSSQAVAPAQSGADAAGSTSRPTAAATRADDGQLSRRE
jgi:chromosome segregation ATPase